MDWPELAALPPPWIERTGASPVPASAVLFTRVQTFRNFAGLPFVVSAPPNACQASADKALDLIAKRSGAGIHRLIDLPPRLIRLLREREILPQRAMAFPGKKGFKFVAVARGGASWTLVNEVEHVTFGRLFPGAPSVAAFGEAFPEDFTEALRPSEANPDHGLWAWSKNFGYLCSDPSRIGPGKWVEMVVHLPGLGITRQLPSARNFLAASGAGFLPIHSGPDIPTGPGAGAQPGAADIGLFRLVFRCQLGKTAKQVYQNVLGTVETVLRRENQARMACLQNRRKRLEERVEQSLKLLRESGSVSYRNLLAAASFVRLGAGLDMLNPQFAGILEELRVRSASGHLSVSSGKDLSQEEEDFSRANVVRSFMELLPDRA